MRDPPILCWINVSRGTSWGLAQRSPVDGAIGIYAPVRCAKVKVRYRSRTVAVPSATVQAVSVPKTASTGPARHERREPGHVGHGRDGSKEQDEGVAEAAGQQAGPGAAGGVRHALYSLANQLHRDGFMAPPSQAWPSASGSSPATRQPALSRVTQCSI